MKHDEANFVTCPRKLACHVQIGVFEGAAGVLLDIIAQAVSVVVVEIREYTKLWCNMNQWFRDIGRKHFATLAVTEICQNASVPHRLAESLLATPSLFMMTGFEKICGRGERQCTIQGCEYKHVLLCLNLSNNTILKEYKMKS